MFFPCAIVLLWGLQYKGNVYFYVRNVQNEIMKLVDGTGAVVVTYSYDAWGKPLGVDDARRKGKGESHSIGNKR